MEYHKLSRALSLVIVSVLFGHTLSAPSSASLSSTDFFRSLNSPQDPRIINGTEAVLNSTKHQVSIRRRLNDGYFFGTGHICGASLISENVVLCAAHCFIENNTRIQMEYDKLSWVLCLTILALLIGHSLSSPPSPLSLSPGFFKSLNSLDSRIINGTNAVLNNTKHQVSIRNRRKDNLIFGSGHFCGGSLISKNVVLCAGHCFIDQVSYNGTFLPDSDFIAVMGNLDRFERNNNTLIFDIVKVVKYHEIFNVSTYDQDIVLVMLNASVPADHPNIQPITLNDGPLDAGTMCHVTGWGVTEEGYTSDVLMTVDVPFIPFDVCHNYTAYKDSIHEGMLCAGYFEGERDACQGDSGGPLVCQGLQAGIVSWGNGCADILRPGVYTNVAFYKKWILEKVMENNGTLPKFTGNSYGDGGDGAISLSNSSMILVSLLVVFNVIFSKF